MSDLYEYKSLGKRSALDGMICKIREHLPITGYVYIDIVEAPIRKRWSHEENPLLPRIIEDRFFDPLIQYQPFKLSNLRPIPSIEDCM